MTVGVLPRGPARLMVSPMHDALRCPRGAGATNWYGMARSGPEHEVSTCVATVAIIAPILFDEVPSFPRILGVVVVLGAVAYQNKLHLAVMNRFTRRNGAAA